MRIFKRLSSQAFDRDFIDRLPFFYPSGGTPNDLRLTELPLSCTIKKLRKTHFFAEVKTTEGGKLYGPCGNIKVSVNKAN